MKQISRVCLALIVGGTPMFGWGDQPNMPHGVYTDTASGMITVTSGGRTVEARIGQFTFTPPPAPGGIAQPPQFVPPGQGILIVLPLYVIDNNESGSKLGPGRSNTCTVPTQ